MPKQVCFVIKSDLLHLFSFGWAMELYFGETCRIAPQLKKKKRLELWKDVGESFL